MAWNHNSYEKPNAWDDSKVYKADRLLDDLQVYRIISGQVNAEDYAYLMDKLSWDASELSKLTDDEKMGYISQRLKEAREKNEYYATSSSKTKRRKVEVEPTKSTEMTLRQLKASEKNRQMQKERQILKKEVEHMQAVASSNPLVLEFPAPGGNTIDISNKNVSIFQRPLTVASLLSPEEEEKEEDEGEDEEKEEDEKEETIIERPTDEEDEEEESSEDIIQFSRDAPTAPILGPFCSICGKYGQYICSMTEEDVCSIECKKKAESIYQRTHSTEEPPSSPDLPNADDVISVDPTKEQQYIPNKRRYKDAVTILDSHKCPLCGKTGHLPQDCHLASGKWIQVDRFDRGSTPHTHDHFIQGEALSSFEKNELQALYRKCKAVRDNPTSCCSECRCRANLVYCVHCNTCYCDKYHLLQHIQLFPTHTQLYSFKLRKLLKCANPNCTNTNIYELYMCHKCSSTLHDKYYNMKTATWRREALVSFPNLICCEEHSTWHIMNCDGPQGLVPIVDKRCIENGYYQKDGIVNEMLF